MGLIQMRICYILSKVISEILRNLDQTETLVDKLILCLISWSFMAWLPTGQPILFFIICRQIWFTMFWESFVKPWLTMVDHGFGKFCQP